jgi:hypothetical protein
VGLNKWDSTHGRNWKFVEKFGRTVPKEETMCRYDVNIELHLEVNRM